MTSSPLQHRSETYVAPRAVSVIARPRIHIGLVDLGQASQRCYGGVGFSVDGCPTIWRVTPADKWQLEGINGLDLPAQEQLIQLAKALLSLCEPYAFRAELEAVAKQHVGFGTKTTLSLGLVSAINFLYGLNLTPAQIARASGRGGASGAGIHLFSVGGIVWDGGHSYSIGMSLLPSSASMPVEIPPLLARWEFPNEWRIGLLLPAGSLVAGAEEERFFAANTPTPRLEALETMAKMYHEIIPAFVLRSLPLLQSGLINLHQVGFKKCEFTAQSDKTKALLQTIQNFVPAGMSSMGPLLYAIFHNADDAVEKQLRDACKRFDAQFVGVFRGWNSPHEVRLK